MDMRYSNHACGVRQSSAESAEATARPVMAKLKTLTDEAMRYRREAHVERRCKPHPVLAHVGDRAADKVVTLPTPPDIGPGGEVVDMHPPPEGTKHEVSNDARWKRQDIRNTLAEAATRIAEDASIQRTDLLMQPSFNSVAMAIDAAESVQAGTASRRCSRTRWPSPTRLRCE